MGGNAFMWGFLDAIEKVWGNLEGQGSKPYHNPELVVYGEV